MKRFNMRLKYGTHYMSGDGDGDGGGDGGGAGGDGGGDGTTSWRDSLPDEIKGDKALADFADPGGLAKAYLDTKADVGRSLRLPGPDASVDDMNVFNTSLMEKVPGLTRIPGEGASDETMGEFFRQLGRPDEPSGYEVPEARDDNSKAGLTELTGLAHELGLNKTQFKTLTEKLVEQHNSQLDAQATLARDDQDVLKLDWGSGLDGKTKAIVELAKATGAPDVMVQAIINKQMDSGTMKWMDGMVEALSDPSRQMNFQGDGGDNGRVSPAEANTQIEEIMNKKEYWDSSSPLHAGLKDKVVDLQRIASS